VSNKPSFIYLEFDDLSFPSFPRSKVVVLVVKTKCQGMGEYNTTRKKGKNQPPLPGRNAGRPKKDV